MKMKNLFIDSILNNIDIDYRDTLRKELENIINKLDNEILKDMEKIKEIVNTNDNLDIDEIKIIDLKNQIKKLEIEYFERKKRKRLIKNKKTIESLENLNKEIERYKEELNKIENELKKRVYIKEVESDFIEINNRIFKIVWIRVYSKYMKYILSLINIDSMFMSASALIKKQISYDYNLLCYRLDYVKLYVL
jgi:DNA repair exonuclease SbcCD ATPase subunit